MILVRARDYELRARAPDGRRALRARRAMHGTGHPDRYKGPADAAEAADTADTAVAADAT